MPTPTERQSLETGILGRYYSQHAGGAYDAKSISKWGTHAPLENSLQSRFWTPPGFKLAMVKTEYNNMGGSIHLQGHTTRAYTESLPN